MTSVAKAAYHACIRITDDHIGEIYDVTFYFILYPLPKRKGFYDTLWII